MTATYKPDGYPSVLVYLMADQAQRLIDFVVAVFDATPLRGAKRADGSIRHQELKVDGTVIMVADTMPQAPAVRA